MVSVRAANSVRKLEIRESRMYIPMIPLPIIREPFERIAMDIIGPLPCSRSGHSFYNPTSLMVSIGWGGETAMWVPYISGLN